MGCLLSCCKKNKNKNSIISKPLIADTNEKDKINNDIDAILPVDEKNNNDKSKNEKKEEEKIEDSNTIYSEKGLNLNENIGDDELLIRPDSPLICDYEKKRITFTKNGLIKLFDTLWDLDNYKNVYDKDNLFLAIRYEGTPMNDKFYLIKGIYTLPKAELKYNKDIESLMDICYDFTLRNTWDEALKSVEKYEGNDFAYIVCTWGKSPVFFVSERETIEKRFRFSRGNSTYIMSTSIPLDIYEPKEGVVRFVDFLNLFKISDEGENIFFYSLNQVDFKMPIPQMLINMTLPSTSKTWYKNIKNFANSIIWDREKKTYQKIEADDDDDD